MTRERAAILAAVLGLLLLIALLFAYPRGGADPASPEPEGPTTSKDGRGATESSDCGERITELQKAVDDLEPLGALRLKAGFATGQAKRVMGEPLPHVEGLLGEEAMRALLAQLPDFEVTDLDCGKLPCIVSGLVPTSDPGSVSTENVPERAAEASLGQRVAYSWGKRHEGDRTRVLFALAPEAASIPAEAYKGLSYRANVLAHQDPESFRVPPTIQIPAVVEPDPCGAKATELAVTLAQHEAGKATLESELEHAASIVELIEGKPPEWPEGMDPAIHEEAAQGIADRLDLELVDFNCDEIPCLARLVALVRPETTNEMAMERMVEALSAEGYPPFNCSVGLAPFDPPAMMMTLALGPDVRVSSARVALRGQQLRMEQTEKTSELDWSQPLRD